MRAYARSVYPRRRARARRLADWERAFAFCAEALAAQAAGLRPDCVCVSGNGPSLAALDHAGRAVTLIPWDGPAVRPAGAERAPSLFLPLLRAFADAQPGALARTARLLSSHEWLCFRLGAAPVTSLPRPAFGPFYWDETQCRAFGLDSGKFAPFVSMASLIGTVSAEGARRCGGGLLTQGVPIAAGASDFAAALIGTGCLEPGLVCDRAGSSEGINRCGTGPALQPAIRPGIRCLPHPLEGLFNAGVLIPRSGALFEAYRRAEGRMRDYETLLAELIPPLRQTAGSAPPAGDTRLARGRAVLERMADAVREAAEHLGAAGMPVTEMRVSGGQGKSRLWNAFKAERTGIRLALPELRDGELAGDAVLALCALSGEGPAGIRGCAARLIRIEEVYAPGNYQF
ncbi:MAG: sugar kinase [Treponema sp.]|jgi:sugar (pentulose or hexulose) kinase|nr:sugar kinase [Treponema sp.]